MARKRSLFFCHLQPILRSLRSHSATITHLSDKRRSRWSTVAVFILLSVITALLCIVTAPGLAQHPAADSNPQSVPSQPQPTDTGLLQRGKALYDAGQFAAAIEVLQQASERYQAQGDVLQHAIALSNLSLTYQQLGAWNEANQAITSSLELLQTTPSLNPADRLSVLAQSLQVQGRLQLTQGQAEQALTTWEQATDIYGQINDDGGVIRNQINQAQALQALGLYLNPFDFRKWYLLIYILR